jgi:carbon storage regulator CsrA
MRQFKPHPRRERKRLEHPPTGLVLSREIGEAIIIGDDVLVTVTDVQGERVRLCITAPKHIAVDRLEIRTLKEEARKSQED